MNAKCQCGHSETVHISKQRNLPAYCTKCKAPKAGHSYEEAS
jgi:hypothetical protein